MDSEPDRGISGALALWGPLIIIGFLILVLHADDAPRTPSREEAPAAAPAREPAIQATVPAADSTALAGSEARPPASGQTVAAAGTALAPEAVAAVDEPVAGAAENAGLTGDLDLAAVLEAARTVIAGEGGEARADAAVPAQPPVAPPASGEPASSSLPPAPGPPPAPASTGFPPAAPCPARGPHRARITRPGIRPGRPAPAPIPGRFRPRRRASACGAPGGSGAGCGGQPGLAASAGDRRGDAATRQRARGGARPGAVAPASGPGALRAALLLVHRPAGSPVPPPRSPTRTRAKRCQAIESGHTGSGIVLMDRYALFVDAGYVYAEGGKLCCNTPSRLRFTLDAARFDAMLRELADKRCGLGSLRTYWYDGARTVSGPIPTRRSPHCPT